MADPLLEVFFKNAKQEMKARKSEELVNFIRENRRLFRASSRKVQQLVEELESRGDMSVDALCDALGIPDSVLFRKVKTAEAVALLVDPIKSPLLASFRKQVQQRRKGEGRADPELCMFLVAGNRSLVITNMRTRRVLGRVHVYVAEVSGNDIHVFPVKDAVDRLPQLFSLEETTDE